MTLTNSAAEGRNRKLAGELGVIFGIMLIGAYVLTQTATMTIRGYGYRVEAVTDTTVNALVFILATLYFISLGASLASEEATLAIASVALFSSGFFVLSLGRYFTTVVLDVDTAGGLMLYGFIAIIACMVIYAVVIRENRVLPNALGYLGIVAGIVPTVGVWYLTLSFTPANLGVSLTSANFIFTAFLILFLVWIFASSVFLWRSFPRTAPA